MWDNCHIHIMMTLVRTNQLDSSLTWQENNKAWILHSLHLKRPLASNRCLGVNLLAVICGLLQGKFFHFPHLMKMHIIWTWMQYKRQLLIEGTTISCSLSCYLYTLYRLIWIFFFFFLRMIFVSKWQLKIPYREIKLLFWFDSVANIDFSF